MIYLNPQSSSALKTMQFNPILKSNYYARQSVIENSNQEFFKTRLTKAHLIYFTSSSKVEPDINYVVGHNNPDADSICSAIAYAYLQNNLKSHKKCIAVCPGEPNIQTKVILNRFSVDVPVKTKDINSLSRGSDRWSVSLVDHNQISQSINGITVKSIGEIIDHHSMVYSGIKPISIHTEPVGATATIVADMFKTNNVKIPPPIAGILLGAILSDTFNLESNTTQKDMDMAKELAVKSNTDLNKFGNELIDLVYMKDYDDKPAHKIVHYDMKPYNVGAKVLTISQVFIQDHENFLKNKKSDILDYMNNPSDMERKPDYMVLMITNIGNKETRLIFSDKSSKLVKNAFEKEINDNTILLSNTLSRKSEVEQKLKKAVEELQANKLK
jgi:manganese-dependent inorganic pyrophosphatase